MDVVSQAAFAEYTPSWTIALRKLPKRRRNSFASEKSGVVEWMEVAQLYSRPLHIESGLRAKQMTHRCFTRLELRVRYCVEGPDHTDWPMQLGNPQLACGVALDRRW